LYKKIKEALNMTEEMKSFLEKLAKDEALQKRMEACKSPEEAFDIAKEAVDGLGAGGWSSPLLYPPDEKEPFTRIYLHTPKSLVLCLELSERNGYINDICTRDVNFYAFSSNHIGAYCSYVAAATLA